MKVAEIVGVTLNAGILSVFYTALGGILSYLLDYIIDRTDNNWESKPLWFQIGDVSLQLSVIGIIAFWVTYIMKVAPPIFPVRKELDSLVDTYISGVFFAYAMFLFITFLDDKIKFIYNKLIGSHLETMFSVRKTNRKKPIE